MQQRGARVRGLSALLVPSPPWGFGELQGAGEHRNGLNASQGKAVPIGADISHSRDLS